MYTQVMYTRVQTCNVNIGARRDSNVALDAREELLLQRCQVHARQHLTASLVREDDLQPLFRHRLGRRRRRRRVLRRVFEQRREPLFRAAGGGAPGCHF